MDGYQKYLYIRTLSKKERGCQLRIQKFSRIYIFENDHQYAAKLLNTTSKELFEDICAYLPPQLLSGIVCLIIIIIIIILIINSYI